jgi:hypothetical protein
MRYALQHRPASALRRNAGRALAATMLLAAAAPVPAARPLGLVSEDQGPAPGYCALLPTNNGGHDLRAQLGAFSGARCGRYTVSCAGVDDKAFYVAVLRPSVTARGNVLSFSAANGDYFHTENVREYLEAGFRTVLVAYEAPGLAKPAEGSEALGRSAPVDHGTEAWQCARAGCPAYVQADESGPKDAACRPASIIQYFKKNLDPGNDAGFCAQGHSAGSSQLAYALAHYGAEAWLDYVQLTGWTPFARPDLGCSPDRYEQGRLRAYWGTNPDGTMQYVADRPFAYEDTAPVAAQLVSRVFGLGVDECGARPGRGLSDASRARLLENGIVSAGADYDHPDTVIDAYACASPSSIVDGNGSWYFELIRDHNAGRVFMQTLMPGPEQDRQCVGERVWWTSDRTRPSPIRQLTIDRMVQQCVRRH